jgi:hypothetical protein
MFAWDFGGCVAYTLSDFDFVAAYIIPEDTWSILPMSLIAGRRSLLLPPHRFPRKSPLTPYREAWPRLGKPTGPAL